jgi:hypothetical protein
MFEDTDVCANCECLLADDCCGTREPYVLDGIRYCCEACAVEEECTCGCQEMKRGAGGDQEQAQTPGPVL